MQNCTVKYSSTANKSLLLSIFQFNEPDDWLFWLYAKLKLPPERETLLKEFNQHRLRNRHDPDADDLFEDFMADDDSSNQDNQPQSHEQKSNDNPNSEQTISNFNWNQLRFPNLSYNLNERLLFL